MPILLFLNLENEIALVCFPEKKELNILFEEILDTVLHETTNTSLSWAERNEIAFGFIRRENIVIDFHKILKYAKIVIFAIEMKRKKMGKLSATGSTLDGLTTENIIYYVLRLIRANGSMFVRSFGRAFACAATRKSDRTQCKRLNLHFYALIGFSRRIYSM